MLLSLKNLLQRKTRTLLTVLGIAVGVMAVVVFSAFGEGMANGFSAIGIENSADLTVSQKDALMMIMGALDASIGDELANLSGVTEVAGSIVGIMQLPDSPYFMILGEDPRSFTMARYRLIAGSLLTSKRQVMLGRQSAKNLKKAVGDSFRVYNVTYHVVGIYETGANFEDNGAVITLEDAQRAFEKRHQVSYFKLKLDDPRRTNEIRTRIEARWEKLAVSRSGEASKQDEFLNVYRSMGWVLGLFAVLVGGLGMTNAMLMSVFERTREIGVLRALGWRRRSIVLMIVGEALIMGFAGGFLGLGLGYLVLRIASITPAVGAFLDKTFTPLMLLQALVTALVLGVIGGLYPAWRAASLQPIEAMRSESGVGLHWGGASRFLATILPGNALRNLWRRPTRTLMTMLGLGIGVGFIVAMIAMVAGMRVTFTQLLGGGQADIVIEQANASDASFSSIDERLADRLRTHPEVRAVSRMIFGVATIPDLPFFILYGLDPREEYMAHFHITEGRGLQRDRELLLGRMAANSLDKKVGDTLRTAGSSYTIVGIFENGQPYEDTGGVINLHEAQRLFGKPRQVSFMGVSLRYPERAAAVARELERLYPAVMVSQASELTDRMQDFATMDAVFGALTILMMLVGGIVMMNVMLMSVFERTQEIGVLRAVGWSRRRVLTMVLNESLFLSMFSGVAGLALGWLMGWGFSFEPNYGSLLPALYTPATFLQILLLVLGLGVIGGLFPAWRAANLRPIEALRYE